MEDSENADAETTLSVLSVSAGASHSVALLSGSLLCAWGRGEDGQLGVGDAEERHVPTLVPFYEDNACKLTAVVCGADHTTAYSDELKLVWSWGWGDFGRLGHGNSADIYVPKPVKVLSGMKIKQLACGDCHCLAVSSEGEVYSWGRNQNGQLGLGHTEDSLFPQRIAAFQDSPIRMVAAGAEHTIAVSEKGNLYGWGWGRYGNLGLGDKRDRHKPEMLTSIQFEKFSLVACGWRHSLAVTSTEGCLFTFGWNKYGQLGNGDWAERVTPERVLALREKSVVKISGGWRHTVVVDEEGKCFAWGWNKFGQVGIGNLEDQNSPQLISELKEKIVQVSCGWRHTLAVSSAGNVFAWGRGTNGQLGLGDTTDRSLPRRIEPLSAEGEACASIRRTIPAPASSSPLPHFLSPTFRPTPLYGTSVSQTSADVSSRREGDRAEEKGMRNADDDVSINKGDNSNSRSAARVGSGSGAVAETLYMRYQQQETRQVEGGDRGREASATSGNSLWISPAGRYAVVPEEQQKNAILASNSSVGRQVTRIQLNPPGSVASGTPSAAAPGRGRLENVTDLSEMSDASVPQLHPSKVPEQPESNEETEVESCSSFPEEEETTKRQRTI